MLKVKIASVVAAFALVVGAAVPAASALTAAELVDLLVGLGIIPEEQAAAAQAAVGGSSTGDSCSLKSASDMTVGSQGATVVELQNYLLGMGYSIPAGATGYFGSQTQSALAAYQSAMGISPAAGYFGPVTRSSISCDSSSDDSSSDNDNTLSGGAGSIESYDELGGISNEEVGEGEEDVEIAGIEIEAAEGSDIEVVAVRLDFDQGTATNDDLTDFITEVRVLLDGDEVASVDADEFDEDNNYRKTLTLDGAIIEEEETGELTVEVTGEDNVDSGDEGDTWTLDFTQVRFADATGSIISEDPATDAFTFSVEDFATATDFEMNVNANDTPDEGYVAVEDDDEITLLVFEVEADGSDINIDDIPVVIATTGAQLDEVVDRITLSWDDEEESKTVTTSYASSATFTFTDLDVDIEDGDTVEFTVMAKIATATIDSAQGISLTASVEEDDIDADDETGETVSDADATGSAEGDAQYPLTDGLEIELVSSTATDEDTTADAAGGEKGNYELVIKLTNIDDVVYVPVGHTVSTSSVDTDDGFAFAILNSDGQQIAVNGAGLASTTAKVTDESNSTDGSYYVIDGTQEFTLDVTLTPTTDGYYSVLLYGVNYKVGSAAAADTLQQALPASDADTKSVNLDA